MSDVTEHTGQQPPIPTGAVLVATIPDQPARVLTEAARYARLLGTSLVVVNVDVTRFVAYEDPDGYVQAMPVELSVASGQAQMSLVRETATAALAEVDVPWTTVQLVGDPALAIKDLAARSHAQLIVVGTRRRGFGETVREFFTGSVAARLAHRQSCPILVVPLEIAPDDEPLWPEP